MKIVVPAAFLLLTFTSACHGAGADAAALRGGDSDAGELEGSSSEPVVGGPAKGSCANATADFVYTASRYEGGAAPYPGMIVGEQKLVLKGETLGHTIIRQHGGEDVPADEGTAWTLGLRFLPGTKVVLAATGNSSAGSETYAQKVEVTKLQGLGPSIDDNRFFVHVICQTSWNYLLP